MKHHSPHKCEGDLSKVFLSYSSNQVVLASQLEEQLKARGVDCWRDKSNLLGGDRWPKAIGEAIAQADLLLLLWSFSALSSDFVELEWNIACALKTKIITYRVDATDLPPTLKPLHSWSHMDACELADGVDAVLKSLTPRTSDLPQLVVGQLEAIQHRDPKQVLESAKAIFQQKGWTVAGPLYQAGGNIYVNSGENQREIRSSGVPWVAKVFALTSVVGIVLLIIFKWVYPNVDVSAVAPLVAIISLLVSMWMNRALDRFLKRRETPK